MAYKDVTVQKGSEVAITADGEYLFLSPSKSIVKIEIKDNSSEIVEIHQVERVAVLSLLNNTTVTVSEDINMVGLDGAGGIPGPDPLKLDISAYNSDQNTLVTEINTKLVTEIQNAADFDALKAAISNVTRSDI